MKFLHYEVDAGRDDIITVTLDKQANVKVMDAKNFRKYRTGQKHTCYGGLVKQSPANITPPRQGHWHVVVDLGGYTGTVRASVRVLKR
jgi:hypothetical protein